MSRARHNAKHRASGGGVKPVVFAGEGSENLKEARERKRGGRVHGEGEEAKHRADHKKRARGGHVKMKEGSKAEEARETKAEEAAERKHGGRVHDGHPKHHADGGVAHHAHMHRAKGGRVGANRVPLSTAANIKEVTKGEQKEDLGQH